MRGIEPRSHTSLSRTSTCLSGYFFPMSPSGLGPRQAAVDSSSREHRSKRASHTLIGCHFPDTHRGSAVISSLHPSPQQAESATLVAVRQPWPRGPRHQRIEERFRLLRFGRVLRKPLLPCFHMQFATCIRRSKPSHAQLSKSESR